MRDGDHKPWKTSLILTTGQRDGLDELATRIRHCAEYRPGASELIRALVDAGLQRLRDESFKLLGDALGLRGAREASPLVESWLLRRLSRCDVCGASFGSGSLDSGSLDSGSLDSGSLDSGVELADD